MPNTNSFDTVSLFMTMLDEQLLPELTSVAMEANANQVKYTGGKYIKIPKATMGGLGTYSKTTGYPDNAGVTMTFETKEFTMDRSTKIRLDAVDVDETNFIMSASTVLAELQRTKIAPEVDAYRYSTIFGLANTALKTGNYIPAVGTVFTQLKADIKKIQEVVGEMLPLIIYMSYDAADALDRSTEMTKQLQVIDFTVGNIASKVKSIDGIPIIKVPLARFKSAFTFSATDHYTPASTAMNLNWIIMARSAAIAVVKTNEVKIFDPSANQSANAYDINVRKLHDVWIADNKLDAVYVSYYSTASPALSATVAQGAGTGATKFTATAGTGNTLAYSLSATAASGYYNVIETGLTAYTSGDDISATSGQYLNMYVISAAGRTLKFLTHQLSAGDIK